MTAHYDLVRAEQAMNQLTPVVIDVTEKAKSLASIKDDESFKEADAFLVEIKRTQKRLDDERKKFTAPLDLAKKQIMDAYKPKARLLIDAEMILKGATRKWFLAEQERKRREEARLREEERKRQEDEKLKTAVELEKHGNKAQAEAILDKPIADVKPKVQTSFDGGSSYGRKTWRCKVTDQTKFFLGLADGSIPLDFIEIKYAQMNRAATAMKGQVNWPGVKPIEDVIMGVRR